MHNLFALEINCRKMDKQNSCLTVLHQQQSLDMPVYDDSANLVNCMLMPLTD